MGARWSVGRAANAGAMMIMGARATASGESGASGSGPVAISQRRGGSRLHGASTAIRIARSQRSRHVELRGMKRRLFKLGVFLVSGAIVNVAVAWGCMLESEPDYRSTKRLSSAQALLLSSGLSSYGAEWTGFGVRLRESSDAHRMAITMFGALLTVIGNLIADILYAVLDPRIEY